METIETETVGEEAAIEKNNVYAMNVCISENKNRSCHIHKTRPRRESHTYTCAQVPVGRDS